jgi:putative ABC transport system permease protein
MVGVLGLSESSKSDLLAQLDQLGTNMLQIEAGTGIGFGSGELPEQSPAMVGRIRPVEAVSSIGTVDANVYRTDRIPPEQTGGIAVLAAGTDLLGTLQGTIADGVFLDTAPADYPVTVLGSVTAQRLGIRSVEGAPLVWLGDQWFTVVGILDSIELSPDIDRSALVGVAAAETYLGYDEVPSRIYVRTDPLYIDDVRSVLPATVNPEAPDEVEVTRPSDALEAREAADDAFTSLLLGLGAVALVVGGVGIANVMVISVLERRGEIGLRRALGATRRHIAVQFLGESLMLSAIGGVGGVIVGIAVTTLYANYKGWGVLIPQVAIIGGFLAAVGIGVVAGLYPAMRAARVSPTEALRTL